MKYKSDIQNIQVLLHSIKKLAGHQPISIMEVCGTHTMAIARFGIRSVLPENIKLISGPGCPVCVTSIDDIDLILQCANLPEVILCTFGDMMRVPGSQSSLEIERQHGADIRVVTSTIEALKIAENNPDKEIVFVGIGFETTAPTTAISIMTASKKKIFNYSVLSLHKTMPEALKNLCHADLNVDGFLLPGHVSTIIGSYPYEFLSEIYNKACVISGFELFDILYSIYLLSQQMINQHYNIEIQYKRVVHNLGNKTAQQAIDLVFESHNTSWRGLGLIPDSGLEIRATYSEFNAREKFQLHELHSLKKCSGCKCGDILRGILEPQDCSLFGTYCTPENPVGPCMVSQEGACAAQFQFRES